MKTLYYTARLACTVSVIALATAYTAPAIANPDGGNVIAGSASIAKHGKKLDIKQKTDHAIINWRKFDIAVDEHTQFHQPSKHSVTLNRVTSNDPSRIMGKLSANGNVVLVNPNGIFFSKTARVDVNGLIGTTADIADKNFMEGPVLHFDKSGKADARIINEGRITAKEAGLIGLIAPQVENRGVIEARLGTVQLASGTITTIDLYGDGLMKIRLDEGTKKQLISNSGTIAAEGGSITLTAASGRNVVDSLILAGGALNVSSVTQEGGKIIIRNAQDTVTLSGNIRANSTKNKGGTVSIGGKRINQGAAVSANGSSGGIVSLSAEALSLNGEISAQGTKNKGGAISLHATDSSWETTSSHINANGAGNGGSIRHMAGKRIITSGNYSAASTNGNGGNIDLSAASLQGLSPHFDASGKTGGGRVRLGGEFQGGKNLTASKDELPNADYVVLNNGTTIRADATGTSGRGGEIVIWSDQQTTAFGTISALPGESDGKGGFVEISSADTLTMGAKVATGIGNRKGEVLLDPKNITISAAAPAVSTMLIGSGYAGLGGTIQTEIDGSDNFGFSVALDDNRMAIGARNADGSGNAVNNSGEVFLLSFTDSAFNGAALEGIIGRGFTGGKNIDVTNLGGGDNFGSSLSIDGNRLVVGALSDDASNNGTSNAGAVYLFSFTDSTFSGGTLEAIIGKGYTGGKNYDLTVLEGSDAFGGSVALEGNQLAVGAYNDDGATNAVSNSGAVYLFTFSDNSFNGASHVGTIGNGYAGGKNINMNGLAGNDYFGGALSIDSNRLAVGADEDDGSGNATSNSGAIYLFSFTDSTFSGGTLEATVGKGYAGGKNIDVSALAVNDWFGHSVALEGNYMVVGAYNDDGSGNATSNSGAVYYFSFSDTAFNGGSLVSTIGKGYNGGNNVDVSSVEANDTFGQSVALNNGRLAIGAMNDDGQGNVLGDSGAVYLLSNLPGCTVSTCDAYGEISGSSTTLTTGMLTTLLSSAQNVTLQANNDITLSDALTVNNGAGDGGILTLQAGRSILLNASITTDNGNLNLYANEDLATGVLDAQRDTGIAVITMAPGTNINAGTGTVTIRLDDGAGKTNAGGGNITLRDITAGTISVRNHNTTGDVVLAAGTLTASAAGNAIELVSARNFINNSGAGALSTPAGDWLVYSTDPGDDTVGGLTSDFRRFSCTYGGSCPALPANGKGLLYSLTPTLDVTPDALDTVYGSANPTFTYTLSGWLGGDQAMDNITGSTIFGSDYVLGDNAGDTYTISRTSDTLASALGYGFNFDTATGNVTKAMLTITADDVSIQANTLPSFTASYSGFVLGQNESSLTTLPDFTDTAPNYQTAGTYTVTPSGAVANNYDLTYVDGMLTITAIPGGGNNGGGGSTPGNKPSPTPSPSPGPLPEPVPDVQYPLLPSSVEKQITEVWHDNNDTQHEYARTSQSTVNLPDGRLVDDAGQEYAASIVGFILSEELLKYYRLRYDDSPQHNKITNE